MRACLLSSQTCPAIGQRHASVTQRFVFVDPKARTARPLPTTVASTPLPRQHSGQLLVSASVATESVLSVADNLLCEVAAAKRKGLVATISNFKGAKEDTPLNLAAFSDDMLKAVVSSVDKAKSDFQKAVLCSGTGCGHGYAG